MQRLRRRDDDGKVAIWVAFFIVPLLVIAALSIDVGAMHADRQRLQIGADAAALAVAQDCARGQCIAGTARQTAGQLAAVNNPVAAGARATISELDLAGGYVEVVSSTERLHWFAPVTGITESALEATAAAEWGYPTGGPAVMPFAVSWCALTTQARMTTISRAGRIVGVQVPAAGVSAVIHTTKTGSTTCTGPSGNAVPGGFGWLQPTGGCGETVTDISTWARSGPGNSVPSTCQPSDLQRWIGQTVYIPIYDGVRGQGSNAEYDVFGYVAFRLDAYALGGQFVTANRPCTGNDRCIQGTFLRYADLESDFVTSASGPPMGASVVRLRLPDEARP